MRSTEASRVVRSAATLVVFVTRVAHASSQAIVWEGYGESRQDQPGTSIDWTSDFDGDGLPDALAGAPFDVAQSRGKVTLTGPINWSEFGRDIATLGGVNHDVIDDFAIAGESPAPANYIDSVFVDSDRTQALLARIDCPATHSGFGPLVATAFDALSAWPVNATVPPGLAGHTLTLRSYATGFSGKVVVSSEEDVTFL
jgi:hypothetical protein